MRRYVLAARDTPEFFHQRCPSTTEGAGDPQERAQGMPDAQGTRSRACRIDSTRVSHHRYAGSEPAFPARWFYGFLRALLGDRALLPPSSRRKFLRDLNASVGASGPHDFAVRVRCSRQQHHSRPSHPAPNVRDDRDTPLLWKRDGANKEMICV